MSPALDTQSDHHVTAGFALFRRVNLRRRFLVFLKEKKHKPPPSELNDKVKTALAAAG